MERYILDAAKTDHPDYTQIAARLQDEQTLRVLHAAMGLVTEAGEIMDAVKKCIIYGKPLDMINLKEEGGDSFWYHALLARAAGYTFADAQETNIAKLRARYPEEFTEHAALNRDLDKERQVLEGQQAACSECGGMGTITHDILVGGTEHDTEEVDCPVCSPSKAPAAPRCIHGVYFGDHCLSCEQQL